MDGHRASRADSVRVVPLEPSHLKAVARLHRDVLPPSFFSRLGQRYLRAYLDTYRASPHALAVVALVEDEVKGFLVGSVSPAPHARWVIRAAGTRLALIGLLGLLSRPGLLALFLRTRLRRYLRGLTRRLRPAAARTDTVTAVSPAVLAHVAVAPDAQRLGVGQALAQRFVGDVRASGGSAVELVTRAESDAEKFYARLGYERVGQRVDDDGTAWARYRLLLV